jgi:hypothetical protein
MQNANSSSTDGSGLGSGIAPGMGSNKFNMPKTPTPGARYGASNNGGSANQAPPYRPPQLRGDPIPRPDSRASTATFASQAPIPQSSFTSPNGSGSDPFVTPEGHYRLGQNALPRHVSQLSLFSHEQHSPQPRFSFKNNNMIHPPPMNSSMFDNSSRGIHLQPGTEAHARRAASLADMIKAGGTDDPRDPDYGNPGPSRRPAPVTKSPVVKLKRGDVVAGAGQGNTMSPRQFSKEEPNINGNAAAFLNPVNLPLPPWFDKLAQGSMPTFEEFMMVIPVMEACSFARPSTAGVIHITNMPYSTSRNEIIAMLGTQAKIIAQPPGSPFHAVHIVMDRQSGKTMDAFVEVETGKEARLLVTQFAGRAAKNRQAKLGDRSVEVNLSNRDEMLATLFPRAKNVTWVNGVPKIDERVEYFYPGVPSTGFNGFLQDEEITHMAKHAETPQRVSTFPRSISNTCTNYYQSPFATRCLIRTYECLITTLYKYPWFATEHVLEVERVRLFECVKTSVRALINLLTKTHGNPRADSTKPTTNTLKELAVALLICPGFSEKEKAQVVADLKGSGYHQLTRPHGMNLRFGGNHAFAEDWPFKIAAKHPGVSDQIMEVSLTFRLPFERLFANQCHSSSLGSCAMRLAASVPLSLISTPPMLVPSRATSAR